MTLSRRIGFELLIGMAALLLISQAVEFVQAQKAHRALTKSSLDLLQQRELQQVNNFYAAVEHNLSAATARGDMDEFDRVSALQKEAPGFEEFSLYDGNGRIFSSSVRNAKGRLLAADLKARLYAQPERLQQTSTNGIEIYKSVVATAKCLECHENQKVGAVVGVTYFRFSNDAVTQLAGQFATSQAAANRHWQILAGSVLLAGILLACGLAAIVSRPIIKIVAPLVHQLGGQSHDIFLAATQVSTSSQVLADGASNQAASLEEASASLEEVAAMTRRNDENAKVVREFTTQTRKVSEAGANSTREVRRSMEGIREAGDQLRDAMNGINSASHDVSKVIKSIDEIAFQTNLLALNAAVEAARAGEAGLGFAVVADEVRSLAQRCAVAAKETTEMISASIQRSQEGVRITDKVTVSVEAVTSRSRQLEQQLEEILSCAKRVEEQMAQIAVASTEQTAGVSEVSTAICHLDKVTQNNAASAEESSAAALELTRQARLLKEALGGLQELIGGHRACDDSPRTEVKSRADSAPCLVREQGLPKARSNGAPRTAKMAELAEVAD